MFASEPFRVLSTSALFSFYSITFELLLGVFDSNWMFLRDGMFDIAINACCLLAVLFDMFGRSSLLYLRGLCLLTAMPLIRVFYLIFRLCVEPW